MLRQLPTPPRMASGMSPIAGARWTREMMRTVATIALLAGAAGSVWFTLQVGRHNRSVILMGMFLVWVLSPFVGLLFANMASSRWNARTRAVLYSLMLFVALGSLAIYGYAAWGPPMAKPAGVFLMVPLASWLLMAIMVPLARRS